MPEVRFCLCAVGIRLPALCREAFGSSLAAEGRVMPPMGQSGNARIRENAASNKHVRRKPRRKQLGVTDDDYARMSEAQGGGCAICGNPPKTRRLDVDHDHRTGRVRGLLCHRCNRALPNWITADWLLHASDYLRRYA